MPLAEMTTAELRDGDRVRLTSLKITVPTDEQIARARAKAGDDLPIRAQIEFTLEPLSYRRSDNGHETGFVVVTKGGQNGLTQSEIEAVRRDGWAGVPATKVLNLSRGYSNRKKADDARTPYERFMWYLSKAGIVIKIQGFDDGVPADVPNGQLWSPAIGKCIVVKSGFDEFPGADNSTYSRFVHYFESLDEQYVAPPMDERDVRQVKAREDEPTSSAATTVASAVLDGGALRSALDSLGVLGRPADMNAEQQQSIVAKAIGQGFYDFGTNAVMDAADKGTLVEFLENLHAVEVRDGVLV